MRGKAKRTKEDKLWSDEIKENCGSVCLICGDAPGRYLNAHHLIPKEIKEHRYDLENGIALCTKHHRFSFKLSAHQNPIAFIIWFESNYPEWYKLIKNKLSKLH